MSFLAVVTNPRTFRIPTPLEIAIAEVTAWTASSSVRFLSEIDGYIDVLVPLLFGGQAVGGRVHDARVAALCIQHGVQELWTADRDFTRFPSLRTRNPLVPAP